MTGLWDACPHCGSDRGNDGLGPMEYDEPLCMPECMPEPETCCKCDTILSPWLRDPKKSLCDTCYQESLSLSHACVGVYRFLSEIGRSPDQETTERTR